MADATTRRAKRQRATTAAAASKLPSSPETQQQLVDIPPMEGIGPQSLAQLAARVSQLEDTVFRLTRQVSTVVFTAQTGEDVQLNLPRVET